VKGTVYTETVVWSAPEAYAKDVPYQLVIVTLEDGKRITGRTMADRLAIGDPVERAEERNGIPYFKLSI
jgi:uncharacterized OB-fold protein